MSNFKIVCHVRPDSKGRVTLGKLAKEVSSYNLSVSEDGRILLEPYVEIPAKEQWLFKNNKAISSVRRGLEQVARGRVQPVSSFSEYADEE